MRRALMGMAALIAVTFILFGWPWLLWFAATGPLAEYLPDLANLGFALTHPDASGLLLVLVLLAAGAAWVVTAGSLVVELLAQAKGVSAPRLNGFVLGSWVPQTSMSRLAATALFIVPFSATVAGPASADSLAPAPAVVAVSAHETCDSDARSVVASHTVQPGDTLWSVADEELGDGSRYPEVFQASQRVTQPDGGRLRDPDMIRPGWRLLIPGAADRSAQGCSQRGSAKRLGPQSAKTTPERLAPDEVPPRRDISKPGSDERATTPPPTLDRSPGLQSESEVTPAQTAPTAAERITPGTNPAAPAALPTPDVRVVAVGSDRAELTWSHVPGASSFWVLVQGQSMQVPGTAIALRGLEADTDYRIEVRAMFSSGEWSKATVLQIQTATAPTAHPHSAVRQASLRALRHPAARGAALSVPTKLVPESASPATRCLTQMRVALGMAKEPVAGYSVQKSGTGHLEYPRAVKGVGGPRHQRLTDQAAALADLCPPHMQRADLIDRANRMSSSWLPGTAAANIITSGVTSVRT